MRPRSVEEQDEEARGEKNVDRAQQRRLRDVHREERQRGDEQEREPQPLRVGGGATARSQCRRQPYCEGERQGIDQSDGEQDARRGLAAKGGPQITPGHGVRPAAHLHLGRAQLGILRAIGVVPVHRPKALLGVVSDPQQVGVTDPGHDLVRPRVVSDEPGQTHHVIRLVRSHERRGEDRIEHGQAAGEQRGPGARERHEGRGWPIVRARNAVGGEGEAAGEGQADPPEDQRPQPGRAPGDPPHVVEEFDSGSGGRVVDEKATCPQRRLSASRERRGDLDAVERGAPVAGLVRPERQRTATLHLHGQVETDSAAVVHVGALGSGLEDQWLAEAQLSSFAGRERARRATHAQRRAAEAAPSSSLGRAKEQPQLVVGREAG